jgi:hypothetical protein
MGATLENCLFQFTWLESVHLKNGEQCFQNVGALHRAGTMHHKSIVALGSVPTCPGVNYL